MSLSRTLQIHCGCWPKRLKSYVFAFVCLAAMLGITSCRQPPPPEGALVVTQTPVFQSRTKGTPDELDKLYPQGSRIILIAPPYRADEAIVLSDGLQAAGAPVVSWDGRKVYFTGKTLNAKEWQIYEANLKGGRPRPVTSMPGGAMQPAILGDGRLIFSSPVPSTKTNFQSKVPQLFVQTPGKKPEQITFGSMGATDPTVLPDGRILFVGLRASGEGVGLYTVNNDGTEITAFACLHDQPQRLLRPRCLDARHVGFISATVAGQPERVLMSRPFLSRAKLWPELINIRCRSVEPDTGGGILASITMKTSNPASDLKTYAIYHLDSQTASLPRYPFFDDPLWHDVEAVQLAPRPTPKGHMSTVTPEKNSGLILCLDANRTDDTQQSTPARSIRIQTTPVPGKNGKPVEIRLEEDGSFFIKVPANQPLNFEALDENGQVLRRCPSITWVRPGENRGCIGCHEPHNRIPRNHRALALENPPVEIPDATTPPKPLAMDER